MGMIGLMLRLPKPYAARACPLIVLAGVGQTGEWERLADREADVPELAANDPKARRGPPRWRDCR